MGGGIVLKDLLLEPALKLILKKRIEEENKSNLLLKIFFVKHMNITTTYN
jgi:hypothetical protein